MLRDSSSAHTQQHNREIKLQLEINKLLNENTELIKSSELAHEASEMKEKALILSEQLRTASQVNSHLIKSYHEAVSEQKDLKFKNKVLEQTNQALQNQFSSLSGDDI